MDNSNPKKPHLSLLTGRRATDSFSEFSESSKKDNSSNILSPNLGNHR